MILLVIKKIGIKMKKSMVNFLGNACASYKYRPENVLRMEKMYALPARKYCRMEPL
jgi:hypothetical protein